LALRISRQAAVLQAMQFAPNGHKWKAALSKGDVSVRSTKSKQAKVLGDTSIGDMENTPVSLPSGRRSTPEIEVSYLKSAPWR
jgi:hypothetical protein